MSLGEVSPRLRGLNNLLNTNPATTISLTGTSNQITITGNTSQPLSSNVSWTISIPVTFDLSANTWLKIPQGTSPTVDAAGKIAIDTNTDNSNITQGSIIYHDGTRQMYTIAVDTLPTVDGNVVTYDGTNKKYKFATPTSGAFVKIGTATASNSATISFTGLSSTYLYYQLVLVSVIPQTSTANMLMRFSTNNGSSYDSTSGHYEYQAVYSLASNSTTTIGSTSATSFIICNSMGTNANQGANGFINIYNPSQANDIGITYEVVYPFSTATAWNGGSGSGLYLVTTGAVNALQILMSSGNISSGTFELYGVTA